MGRHAVVHGHVDERTFASAVPLFQGHHHAKGRPDSRDRVADVVAHHLRAAAGLASDRHPPAHSLYAWVVGRPIGIRSWSGAVRVAVAGDADVDQSGVQFSQYVVTKTQALESAGAPVVQEDIGFLGHPFERGFASRVSEVQRHALLVSVEAQVAGADPTAVGPINEWTVATATFTHSRAFDLDDLRSHITKDHGRKRAGHYMCYVHDTDPGQGQRG